MKKNNLKTILSLAIAFSISVGVTTSKVNVVNAAGISSAKIITVQVPNDVSLFAAKEFPKQISGAAKFATEYGLDSSDATHYTLGTAFNIYNFANDYITDSGIYYFPVLYKGKIKATLAVTKSKDGSLSSTFSKGFASKLEDTLESNANKQFRLINIDGEIRAVNDKDAILVAKDIYKDTAAEVKTETINKINYLAKNNISKKYNEVINNITPLDMTPMVVDPGSGLTGSQYLSVPIVYQCGYPWCWAATCASIINYKKGAGLYADDVVKYIYGSVVYTASGTSKQDIQAYNHWGLYPCDYCYNETWSDAKYVLNSNNPIHSLWYPISSNNGHSMTVRGYEAYSDGSIFYLLIDPNVGYVSVTAHTYSGDCVYSMNGTNYYWSEFMDGF